MGKRTGYFRAIVHVTALACVILLVSAAASGQTTATAPAVTKVNAPVALQPATSTTRPAPVVLSALERTTLVRASAPAPAGTGTTSVTPSLLANPLDFTRVLLALLMVVVIVLLLRWAARLMFPGAVGARPGRVVQVLSRSIVSPKQQVMVMQVGQRLLVVGDCGTQMNTLCEITDPDEVASLIGQVNQERRDPISTGFASLFRRAGQTYSADTAPAAAHDEQDPSTDAPAPPGAEQSTDLALVSTKQEIDGLMDRVRGLSKQFGRP